MRTKTFSDLSKRIELVVQDHIAASRKAAETALRRAFATATKPTPPSGSGKTGERRAPTEIMALGERFYQAVCAKPGETMAHLAAELGVSAYELHRPMANLRRAGRVRSVGYRHLTRYFPMATTTSRSA